MRVAFRSPLAEEPTLSERTQAPVAIRNRRTPVASPVVDVRNADKSLSACPVPIEHAPPPALCGHPDAASNLRCRKVRHARDRIAIAITQLRPTAQCEYRRSSL